MNKAYRLIWDDRRNMLVIVDENSRSRGKKAGKGGGRVALPAAALFALGLATAAPFGGEAWATAVCVSSNGTSTSQTVTGTISGSNVTFTVTLPPPTESPTGQTGSNNAVACGDGANAGTNAVAVGGGGGTNGAQAAAQAVAVGAFSKAQSQYSTAVGRSARVNENSESAIAIGGRSSNNSQGANATGAAAIALGGSDGTNAGAVANGRVAIAVGSGANARGESTIAVGRSARAWADKAIAVGQQGETFQESTIQTTSGAWGTSDIAVGTNAAAYGQRRDPDPRTGVPANSSSQDGGGYYNDGGGEGSAIAVGNRAQATRQYAIAVGLRAIASGDGAVAVGRGARALTPGSIVIGGAGSGNQGIQQGKLNTASDSTSNGGNSVAIGYGARNFTSNASGSNYFANTKNSTALGWEAHTHAANAVAIGSSTDATGERSFAIGTASTDADERHQGARAAGQGSIVIGDQALAVTTTNLDHQNPSHGLNGSRDLAVNDSMAIGTLARTAAKNAIALGGGASYTTEPTIVEGVGTTYYYDGVEWVHLEMTKETTTAGGTTKEFEYLNDGGVPREALPESGAQATANGAVAIGGASYVQKIQRDTAGKPILDSDGKTQPITEPTGTVYAGRPVVETYIPAAQATAAQGVALGSGSLANREAGEDATGQVQSGYNVMTGKAYAEGDDKWAADGSVWQSTLAAVSVGTNGGIVKQGTDGVYYFWANREQKGGIQLYSVIAGSNPVAYKLDNENGTYFRGDDWDKDTNDVWYQLTSGSDKYKVYDKNGRSYDGSGTPYVKASDGTFVAVANSLNDYTRQITGVAAGYEDTDAVNVAQLKMAADRLRIETDNRNVGLVTVADNAREITSPYIHVAGVDATAKDINEALKDYLDGKTKLDGKTYLELSDAQKPAALEKKIAQLRQQYGYAQALGDSSIAIGSGSMAGTQAAADALQNVERLRGIYQTAYQTAYDATAGDAAAKEAAATAAAQTEYNDWQDALSAYKTDYAQPLKNAIAIGTSSQAQVADSAALGSGSVANRDKANGGQGAGYDVVTGGAYAGKDMASPTWSSTAAAVSVGDETGNTILKDGNAYYLYTQDGTTKGGLDFYRQETDNTDPANPKTVYVADPNGTYIQGDDGEYYKFSEGTNRAGYQLYSLDDSDPNDVKYVAYTGSGTPYVEVKDANDAKTYAAVGSTLARTRQITNVAAGTMDTDAVNVAQLKRASALTTDNRNVGLIVNADGEREIVSPYIEVEGVKEAAEARAFMDAYNTEQAYLDFKAQEKGSALNTGEINNAKAEYKAQQDLYDSFASATGANAVAVGKGSAAQGQESVALMGNTVGGEKAIAWGSGNTAGQWAYNDGTTIHADIKIAKDTNGKYLIYAKDGTTVLNDNSGNGYDTFADAAANANLVKQGGKNATAFGKGTVAVGDQATAFGANTVAGAYKQGTNDVLVKYDGTNYQIYPINATTGELGTPTSATTLDGLTVDAAKQNQTAWGSQSTARGSNATAFGDNSRAAADNSLAALGGVTEAAATNSAAIGNAATVKVADAAAIGSGAAAARDNVGGATAYTGYNVMTGKSGAANTDYTVGGEAAWVATQNAIAVGNIVSQVVNADGTTTITVMADDGALASQTVAKGAAIPAVVTDGTRSVPVITRQITGVAAGRDDTDAVNVAQLKASGMVFGANVGGTDDTTKATRENKLGTTVEVVGTGTKAISAYSGKNVKTDITQDASGKSTITVKIDENPSFTSVTAGTGNSQVVIGSDGVQVGGNTYINNDGLNANSRKITNVAPGTAGTDAVNLSQLQASQTAVQEGKNVKVTAGTDATDQHPVYTVNAYDTQLELGTGLKLDGSAQEPTAANDYVRKYKLAVDKAGAPGTTGDGRVSGGAGDQYWDSSQVADAINAAAWNIQGFNGSAQAAAAQMISAGGKVNVIAGKGLTLTQTNGKNQADLRLENVWTISQSGNKTTINDGSRDYTITSGSGSGTDTITTVTANGGQAADSTDGNISLTKSTDGDGNPTYDVSLADTVNLSKDGGVNIGGDSDDNRTTIGAGNVTVAEGDNKTEIGGNVIRLTDGAKNNTGSITGLASHLDDNQSATGVSFAYPTGDDAGTLNEAATLGDVLNAGWNLQANGDAVDFVTHGDTVNLTSDGGSVTITPTSENGVSKLNLEVNADAVLDGTKPLKFQGDNTSATLEPTHGGLVGVKGGASGNLTEGNIGVVGNATDNTLTVKLAKDIDLGSDGSVTTGDTNINTAGLTIKDGPSITKDSVDMGGNQIHNVAAGTAGTDAVNVNQLEDLMGGGDSGEFGLVVGDTIDQTAGQALRKTLFSVKGGEGEELTAVLSAGVSLAGDDPAGYSTRNLTTRLATDGSGDNTIYTLMSENPSFRNRDGRTTVQISGDSGNMTFSDPNNSGNTTTVSGSGVTVAGSGGNQPIVISQDNVSMGGRQIHNVAAGTADTDAVNVSQLRDQHINISDGRNTSGLYSGDTITFTGDGNIHVNLNGQTVSINLDQNLRVNSITLGGRTRVDANGLTIQGGPSVTVNGIDAAGTRIVNVADGVNPYDAVNRGQMDALDRRLSNRIGDVEDNAYAGIASAVAHANIPQVITPGKGMLGAGLGYYKDNAAVGVGYSVRSDNGKWVLRTSFSVNPEEVTAGGGIGYEF